LSLILKILFVIKAKKRWKLPPKKEIIILDENGSDRIIDLVLGHDDCEIFEDRKEIINIPIFLLSIFNYYKYTNYSYRATYIKYTGAKYAISYTDMRVIYADVVNLIPECELILIQSGIRRSTWDYQIPKNKNYSFKYYFTANKYWSKYVSKNIDAKCIEIGHIAANNFRRAKNEKIKQIQWISNWRVYNHYWEGRLIPFEIFHEKPIKFCLNNIKEFCEKNDLKIQVLGTSSVNKNKEHSFYNSILKDYEFIPRVSNINKNMDYSTHEKIRNDSIICGIDTGFLNESFGRGFRTAFFSIRSHYTNVPSLKYPWPKKLEDFGPFWVNEPNPDEIKKALTYLFNVTETDWQKNLDKYKDYTMDYDYKNKIIKNVLRKEGLKIL
jgi:surface carbohydrate biosynthesis protein